MPFRNLLPLARPRARLAVPGLLAILALAGWAWATNAPPPAAACLDSPPATMELSIGSGVTSDGKESRIEVRAHPDGCVAVHRPWFLRDAGDYEVRLSRQEWASLQNSVAVDALGKVDQKSLSAQTKNTWTDSTNGSTVFADLDADVVTLRWNNGGTARQLVTRGAQLAAAREPSAAGLNQVAEAIRALRTLSMRAGTRVQAESAP